MRTYVSRENQGGLRGGIFMYFVVPGLTFDEGSKRSNINNERFFCVLCHNQNENTTEHDGTEKGVGGNIYSHFQKNAHALVPPPCSAKRRKKKIIQFFEVGISRVSPSIFSVSEVLGTISKSLLCFE